ncbi:hypothetical protein [Mesorhizobium sp. WSM2239]|uniref:Uncharacterized protein n=2 Tax=unclassified Mesorhizobium TaxID=325217 RepID=A0AAU8DC36_9HYPH
MNLHIETAAPMGSIIGNGGNGISKAVAAQIYRNPNETATSDYTVLVVASRFRLTVSTAREVCRMAGIGGVI